MRYALTISINGKNTILSKFDFQNVINSRRVWLNNDCTLLRSGSQGKLLMSIYKGSHVLSWRMLWAKDTVSPQLSGGRGARYPSLGRSALSNPQNSCTALNAQKWESHSQGEVNSLLSKKAKWKRSLQPGSTLVRILWFKFLISFYKFFKAE